MAHIAVEKKVKRAGSITKLFNYFTRKISTSSVENSEDGTSSGDESKNEFRVRMKELPPDAMKVFKSSGLKEADVIQNWDVFLNCLYYSSRTIRPKLRDVYKKYKRQQKRALRKNRGSQGAVSMSTMSQDLAEALSSYNSRDEDESSDLTPIEYLGTHDVPREIQVNELMELHSSSDDGRDQNLSRHGESGIKTAEGRQEEDQSPKLQPFDMVNNQEKASSRLDSDFEVKLEADTSTAQKKINRKHFKLEEVMAMVTEGNPKEKYGNFHEIGRGSYGKVFIATDRQTKQQVAIKHIHKGVEEDLDGVANEIAVLDSCHHVNVVNYICSYMYNKQIWMVMEFVDAGSLKQLLVIEMQEDQISYIVQQVLKGLEYLHGLNRIHRDIKSANILLNMNGDVKLADLGLCVEGEGEQTGMAGSKYWMAPEMIKREPYTSKVDIWSTGALCVEMAEGNPPYSNCKPLKALFLTATVGAPPLRKADKWSTTFKEFLQSAFTMDQNQRPTTSDLLKHPFFNKISPRSEIIKALKLVFLMRVTAGL